ncbi:hypothetical protein B0H13DRAFT_452001 [Mycena leptocephala]|nr:hypothetical protein B0H13DRAFT_452001 [Mycena leptocephala]
MSFHRSVFNSGAGDDADQQGSANHHSRSNSGQWAAPSGWNQALGQPTVNPGPYYPGAVPPGPGYPPTMYTQPSSSFGAQHPQQHGYQSAHIDPRTTYTNQAPPSANIPMNYAPQNSSTQFGMSAGNQHRMSGMVPPSFNPNAAQPTQWSSIPYNSNQSYHPSMPRTNTPAPTPSGSSRNNHGRHHPPSAQIVVLPESQPGDYITDNSTDGKVCSHCHATSTPLWRRDPRTHKPLCNACGLYLYQRQEDRPQNLIGVDNEHPSGGDSDGDYDGPECSNCGTRKTSTWRRSKAGDQVCNACGVYERMNGKPRPLALRTDKIRPRTKHV